MNLIVLNTLTERKWEKTAERKSTGSFNVFKFLSLKWSSDE